MSTYDLIKMYEEEGMYVKAGELEDSLVSGGGYHSDFDDKSYYTESEQYQVDEENSCLFFEMTELNAKTASEAREEAAKVAREKGWEDYIISFYDDSNDSYGEMEK
jgi:hypothetical protein